MSEPLVTIIIPHYEGEILLECLGYLFSRTPIPTRVLVIDDYPDHESIQRAKDRFPQIEVLRNDRNIGFSASCNRGLRAARSRYVLLLNNDVEVTDGWLEALVETMEGHPEFAACQPKIRSSRDRNRFDYSGAAGGLIDCFGYAFCLGRVFDVTEEDRGQYDNPRPIFWASGTAILIRRKILDVTGFLDENLWMHWEEIDLCWRIQISGGTISSVPASVIYHYSGWTLPGAHVKKLYLNHRNNLIALIKNTSSQRLLWVLPVRIGLEVLTILRDCSRLEWKRPLAVVGAFVWLVFHPLTLLRGRRKSQMIRRVADRKIDGRIFMGSIVYQHFVKGIVRASDVGC